MSDIDTYYQYHRQQTEVHGQPVTFFSRQALGKWQDGLVPAQLLAEWANVAPQAHVLHLYCRNGLAGAAIAKQLTTGRMAMLDCHIAAIETARRTLQANGVTNADLVLSDCGQEVLDRTFDSVLALLPKSRAVWEQTILDAATVLRIGGDLYLAGATNQGIKSAAKHVARVFGEVQVLGYRGGCRVLRAVKDESSAPPSSDYYEWRVVTAQVDDEPLAFVTKPGLFSWQRLDDGTRLLIEALHARPLRADDQVLDVGCGSGVLTLAAARQAHAGHVTGIDIDCRAIHATRRTLAHSQVTNADALLSDCGQKVAERSFSAVVTNPPFHQERLTTYAIARQIIRQAARLLQRRGRLYLVANSFLKYRAIIEETFGNVQLVRQTNRFQVWHAIKQR